MSGQRESGRRRQAINYDERQRDSGGGPAWVRQQQGARSEGAATAARHKENSKPAAAAQTGGGAGAAAKPAAAKQQRRSAPAVAQRGRDAGITRLPIEDGKAQAGGKPAGSGKARSSQEQPAAADGGKPKQVPGLPGVVVKAGPGGVAAKQDGGGKVAAVAKLGGSGSGKAAAAAAAAATKPGGSSKGAAAGKQSSKSAGSAGQAEATAEPSVKPGSGSSKRKAAAQPEEAGRAAAQPAARSAAAAAAAGVPDGKRQKAAPAAQAAARLQREEPAAAAAAAAEPAVDAELLLNFDPLPDSGAEALVEQYSANFQALQVEYNRLQQLYEDLKAAKIDEEVQQLLEQQNKFVTEHGQKAAQLVEHYKKEAAEQAKTAADLGGNALVDQCHKLQTDLMTCQEALLDMEAASLEKDKQIAEMQARLRYLERFARTYESRDKCIQTDDLPQACASAQFPSLESSGVEMLHAHAMVPEGAGGGSIYKRPKPGSQPVPDPSYTLPARSPLAGAALTAAAQTSPLPAAAASRSPGAAAAAAAVGCSPAVAAAAAVPVSGSDMELTGNGTEQPEELQAEAAVPPAPPAMYAPQQQQQQVQRWQSMQPMAGRVAHAAAAAAPRPAAARPASAESQVQVGGMGAAAAAGAAAAKPAQQQQQSQHGQQQQQRRMSVAPGAAPAAAAAAAAAAGPSQRRRVSAPPAPTDRALNFSSVSSPAGADQASLQLLAAVPEEQPLGDAMDAEDQEQLEQAEEQEQGQHGAGMDAAAEAAAETAAAISAAAAAAVARTPGSVPPPPRDLAITALTGLASTPLKGGAYEFRDPRTGYVFQLWPAPPDSAGAAGDDPNEPELLYKPISLGSAAQLLPSYLRTNIQFGVSQRAKFIQRMMDALSQGLPG